MSEFDKEVYRSLRFLVIDDQTAAREGLRTCCQTMGAFSVEFSVGYKDAIARVKRTVPDVILCDYNLGDDRSGQQLLEEMRRTELLPDETMFIMVTAEKSYENVVAAVELGPDDYIIKPFSPDRLQFRLDRALRRKQFFRPFYAAKRELDFEAAVEFVKQHRDSDEGQIYRFDLMRHFAELQLLKGDPAAALEAYKAILELHPFPWAKAGMARALLQQNRLQEARDVVDEVVGGSPLYFDASDLKTRICMEMGDYDEAQRTVQKTSQRTGRNFARKRLLADAALLNGDAETALAAISDVLENDTSPGSVSIADRLMLVRSHIEAGDMMAADVALRAVSAQDLETASLDDKVSQQALKVRLNPEAERAAFVARRAMWVNDGLSVTARVDLAQAAFALGDTNLATQVTGSLFAGEQIRQVFALLRGLFEAHGLEQVFREMQKQAALQRIGAGAQGPDTESPQPPALTPEPPP